MAKVNISPELSKELGEAKLFIANHPGCKVSELAYALGIEETKAAQIALFLSNTKNISMK